MRIQRNTQQQQPSHTQPASQGWGYSGADIGAQSERVKAEYEKRKGEGGKVFDFYLKSTPNEREAEVIILDESMQHVKAFWEHNLEGPDGKFGDHVLCCKDLGECPVCRNTKNNPYFCMVLTVLDCRPYVSKKGETVNASRKLMRVKYQQIAQFRQILELAEKNHGTCRGVYMVLKRDGTGKDASIGTPQLLDNGSLFDMIDEDQIIEIGGHAPIIDRSGKVVVPANGNLQPFNFDEMFPRPNAVAIAKARGWPLPAGHHDGVEEEFGGGAVTTTRRVLGNRQQAQQPVQPGTEEFEGDDPDDIDGEQVQEQEEIQPPAPPRRVVGARSPAAAAPRTIRKVGPAPAATTPARRVNRVAGNNTNPFA